MKVLSCLNTGGLMKAFHGWIFPSVGAGSELFSVMIVVKFVGLSS